MYITRYNLKMPKRKNRKNNNRNIWYEGNYTNDKLLLYNIRQQQLFKENYNIFLLIMNYIHFFIIYHLLYE